MPVQRKQLLWPQSFRDYDRRFLQGENRCLKVCPVHLIQELHRDFLNVCSSLAYVFTLRLSEKIDEKLSCFHNRITSGLAFGNLFSKLFGEKDVIGHCQIGSKYSLRKRRTGTGEFLANTLTNRRNRELDSLEFLLGIRCDLCGQTLRQGDSAHYNHLAVSNTRTGRRSEVAIHTCGLENTWHAVPCLRGTHRERHIATGEHLLDESAQRCVGGLLIRPAHLNQAAVAVADVCRND